MAPKYEEAEMRWLERYLTEVRPGFNTTLAEITASLRQARAARPMTQTDLASYLGIERELEAGEQGKPRAAND